MKWEFFGNHQVIEVHPTFHQVAPWQKLLICQTCVLQKPHFWKVWNDEKTAENSRKVDLRRASTLKKNACGAGLDQIVEWDSRMKKLHCKCKRLYSLLEGLCCSNPCRIEFSVFFCVGFFAGSSICSYINDVEMCRRTPPQLCLFNWARVSEPEAEHKPWGPAITDKPTKIYMHINTGHQHTFPERPNESKSGVRLRLAALKLGGSAQT